MDEQISPEAQTAGKPTAPGPSRARSASRKHMGVATSDPTYLPPVNNPNAPQRDRNVRVPVRKTTYGSGGSAQTGGVARRSGGYIPPSSPTLQVRANEGGSNISPGRSYISQPKKGHTIFTSRQDRQRRRVKILLAILVVATVALALFWFFALR